jgi:alkylation response protein AidB-like acyl-CoA dehydrogenase
MFDWGVWVLTGSTSLYIDEMEAFQVDRDNIVPQNILSRLSSSGLFGPYTGAESAVRILESVRELARRSVGLASVVLINMSVQFLIYHVLEDKENPVLKEILGHGISAVSLTEKGGGTDLTRNISVEAERSNGDYCLRGEKIFTSNGLYADYFLVLALEDGKPALFVSDDRRSMEINAIDLSSFRGAGIARVVYNCARAVKITESKPMKAVLQAINLGRIGYSAIGIGIAEGSLEDALEYTRERKVFNQPLIEYQGIQWMLADIYARLETVKALYRQALQSLPSINPVQAAVLKNEAARLAQEAAWVNIQVHGGRGLEHHSRPERLYRDARALDIGEGAREVLKTYIASSLARNPGLVTM